MKDRFAVVLTFLLALLCCAEGALAGDVVYGKNSKLKRETLPVPYFNDKPEAVVTGWDFMLEADTTSFWDLEEKIVECVLQGNMPYQLKRFRKITFTTPVVDSVEILKKRHKVEIWVLADYLSIGTDDNFVRMPMGPLAAQRIADSLGCILPTTYLVDRIAEASQGHLNYFAFRPLGDRNCRPIVFQDSDNAIKALYKAYGYRFGDLISGLKKDVVLTYKIHTLSGNEKRVAIYGWHKTNGEPVQPLYVRHVNYYVDYSHGIRLIYREVYIDGKKYDAKEILESLQLYRLLSDEPMHLNKASYAGFPKWIR